MHAEHGLRTRDGRSDGIDIEIRGVGGEDGVGLGQPIELAEHLLLDRHVLRYRFDDDVRLADGLDVGDARLSSRAASPPAPNSSRRALRTRGNCSAMASSPCASAAAFISTMVTGIPALAKHIAIPPPIVPAPMIAALSTRRGVTSLGRSGTLAALRSAKKT